MFYQYNSIFKKTYLSSDPETTLDWSQDFDLSETISGIIFFLATEFDLGLSRSQSQVSETETASCNRAQGFYPVGVKVCVNTFANRRRSR